MLELVNPEIIAQQGEQDGLEGCLSVPGKWGYVKRPAVGEGEGPGPERQRGSRPRATGLVARCFCHELAHLDGHLYTELADRLYTTEELDRHG